jgi:nitric oxide reductase subunit B
MWYARSAEFLQTDLMDALRWLRVVGDTIFAVGIVGLGWFVLGLKTGWSISGSTSEARDLTDAYPPSTQPHLSAR